MKRTPKLLGCTLVCEKDRHTILAKIAETESYDQTDAASHSLRGKIPRTEVMFGPSGFLYVYFTYGIALFFAILLRDGVAV